jgi:Penicillinase repressor
MSDAIQARVDQFVEEILEVLERAQSESQAAAIAAIGAISASLGALTPPSQAPPSSRRSSPPKSKPAPRSRRIEVEPVAPAVEESAPVVETPAAPPPSERVEAIPGDGPAAEREARVLDAVRALARATAGEVAERARQPNGSVVVTLRALMARGLVVRMKTDRGMEYELAARAAVA